MSVELEIKNRIANLISAANAKTGGAETDLTSAVSALVSGFGQGGGIKIGENSVTPNFLNLFYALENGLAVTGEFTLSAPLPAGENLVLDSGLEKLNGLFVVNSSASEKGLDATLVSLSFFSDSGDLLFCSFVLSTSGTASVASSVATRTLAWRLDGGALYVTPQFGGNSNYTPFCAGHRYKWVAW